MRENQNNMLTAISENINHETLASSERVMNKSYHEMSDFPVQEQDDLLQLQTNIAMLEDLQLRFSFVMKEVRYLMKV